MTVFISSPSNEDRGVELYKIYSLTNPELLLGFIKDMYTLFYDSFPIRDGSSELH